jgi:hypothetical protein
MWPYSPIDRPWSVLKATIVSSSTPASRRARISRPTSWST